MAAPIKNMNVSDSSSSDDEQLKRCQEAVWETRADKTKDGDSNVKESKRVVVADHEHDGNELQVTQGFRAHVSKKLGHFLDRYISETQTETSYCLKSTKCHDEDDEGFRLFSTSIPGQKAVEPPAPGRRRPVPSSSDSDSDMESRLKEAAVSLKDLFPSSTLPSKLLPSSAEAPSSERIKAKKKKVAEGEESNNKALKKKKKRKHEESEQLNCVVSAPNQSKGDHGNPEQEHSQVKVKQKKRQKRNSEEEA